MKIGQHQMKPATVIARRERVPGATLSENRVTDSFTRTVKAPRETPGTGGAPDLETAFDAIKTPECRSDVRLLSGNAESWNARWEEVSSASESINAQYYAWDKDVFGMALLGHIYLKARQGVKTNVMVDAVGDTIGKRGFKSHIGGRDYLQELVALPNARAKVYHPNHRKPLAALLHPTGGEGIAANHDKILEIDGKVVIAGGRNISHHYYMDPSDQVDAWRDTDVRMVGPDTAQEYRDAFSIEFDNRWITEEVGRDKLGNWVKRDGELLGAYALMDDWLNAPAFSEAEKSALRSNPQLRETLAEKLTAQAESRLPELAGEVHLSKKGRTRLKALAGELTGHLELRGTSHEGKSADFEGTRVKIIDNTSAVGRKLDEMNGALLSLINSSREKINIQTPYFVLTDPVIDALKAAGERGVKISIATNTPTSTDSGHTQVFFLNDWKKALATIPNMTLYGATGERKMHGKMATFDDKVTVVGSYNLDLVSKQINGEVGAVIWGANFAREANQVLQADFDDSRVGYREYQIARSPEGKALDAHGRLVVDERGRILAQPETVFGPENHVDPAVMAKYEKKIGRWNWLRKHLPQFKELRRFVD